MRIVIACGLGMALLCGCQSTSRISDETPLLTVCNPLDLSYRFMPEAPSRREAADPSIILFKDRYYLFASKSGGYWWSDDLAAWHFVPTDQLPTEEYAPTAIALDDTVYFLASSETRSTVYKSDDPMSGQWSVACEALEIPVWDPMFFEDDDGRLYLYWGCSDREPLYGVEIDSSDFSFKGSPQALLRADKEKYGWEVRGDNNTQREVDPWIEGAWVNKHNGHYYLQYAAPGTLEKSYCDAVYISEHPLGPYRLAKHNPFAYKPGGFACGAGHGCTFEDRYGNLWHAGTVPIAEKHKFERRLAIYPACFDPDGVLHANTRFGDYPRIVPRRRVERFEELFPGWMLLSYAKEVTASSSVEGHPVSHAVDEEIRTYWAAESGSRAEWLEVDLGQLFEVCAVQINFSEHLAAVLGRQEGLRHRYTIEGSVDGEVWQRLVDRSASESDASHDYTPLDKPATCRYLRLNNI